MQLPLFLLKISRQLLGPMCLIQCSGRGQSMSGQSLKLFMTQALLKKATIWNTKVRTSDVLTFPVVVLLVVRYIVWTG